MFLLFLIIYIGTLFTFQMYLIAVYRLFNTLGLYDTRIGMVLICSAICVPVRSFLSVFIPHSLPPTAVVALATMSVSG
ncbi:MAG: hypothetical protein NTU88_15000 [Armatimonadetes bacterium]|nr:hypothetical protein [Armatimonadota bacterium]